MFKPVVDQPARDPTPQEEEVLSYFLDKAAVWVLSFGFWILPPWTSGCRVWVVVLLMLSAFSFARLLDENSEDLAESSGQEASLDRATAAGQGLMVFSVPKKGP